MNIALCELDRRHLPTLNAWRNDPEITALLGGNFLYISGAVDDAWYDSYMKQRDASVRLAIEVDGVYVGNANLTSIHRINRVAEFSTVIGDKNYWGKGIATVAAKKTIEHAFNDLGMHRVWSVILSHNLPSIRMCEKAGMEREGLLREAVYKNGKFHDLVMMAALSKNP